MVSERFGQSWNIGWVLLADMTECPSFRNGSDQSLPTAYPREAVVEQRGCVLDRREELCCVEGFFRFPGLADCLIFFQGGQLWRCSAMIPDLPAGWRRHSPVVAQRGLKMK